MASRSDDGVGEGAGETRSRRRPGATARARKLRRGDNQAEALLWLDLKRRKLGGYKFTRQFPIGPYFADFACREKWLVVELDGAQHAGSKYDRRRDDFMREQGYAILRFWSHEVLKQRRPICEAILAALDGRLAEGVTAFDMRFIRSNSRETAGPAGRPPLRFAAQTTSPPIDGGEEKRERADLGALPLPPEGGEERRRQPDSVSSDMDPST